MAATRPDAAASPCINVCRMDEATGWCEGCLRTLPEIGSWSRATDEEKRQVWAQMPERLQKRRALKS